MCFRISDPNFLVYVFFIGMDSVSHAYKAFKTLRSEYHLLTGRSTWDCFLYLWPMAQFIKKISGWMAIGLLVEVSPIHCAHSPMWGCTLLYIYVGILLCSNRVRKWWVSRYYDSIPIDDELI